MMARNPPCGKKKFLARCFKGFSLPEIVIALGIIIALASSAFAVSEHTMKAGRYNAAKTNVAALSVAVAQYRFEVGSLPANLTALTVKVDDKGPWLGTSGLKDPWNRDYHYQVAADGSYYAIWSDGHNRTNDSGETLPEFGSDDIGIMNR